MFNNDDLKIEDVDHAPKIEKKKSSKKKAKKSGSVQRINSDGKCVVSVTIAR